MFMSEGYHGDLREFLDKLQKLEKLYRWRRPINKDSELMPLMRLQYRGISDEKRQAFLFENVIDGKGAPYRAKVATGMLEARGKSWLWEWAASIRSKFMKNGARRWPNLESRHW